MHEAIEHQKLASSAHFLFVNNIQLSILLSNVHKNMYIYIPVIVGNNCQPTAWIIGQE